MQKSKNSDYQEWKRNKQRTQPKKPKKKNGFLYFLMVIFSAVLASVVAFNLYLASLPPISNFDDIKPNPVTSIYSEDGEIIKTFTVFKFEKVSISEIPKPLKDAIISTEDKNFYTHRGFDTMGLIRSALTNIQAGSLKQGASTITQQLARILFLSNERTFDRKIKELVIAHRIEKTISKDEILEMYLNAVYLGSGTYGVLSASKTYFDKTLDELTLAEMALIAGLPQAPSVYSPFNNPEAALKRRDWVLKRMYRTGCINKKQYIEATKEKLNLNQKPRLYSFNKAPYFVDYVLSELDSLGFDEQEISQGGLKIYTTVKYASQMAATEALADDLKNSGLNHSQAALFSFSPTTGKIYAYVGGKNYEESQYDRVTNAIRPPGSAFKPFVYATALQQGLKSGDMLDDAPISFGKWAPKNYGGKYRGKIPAWLALAVSSNVCAVKLIQKVSPGSVISLARDMGITTALQNDMTIALGSNGVKLYDMVIAYGAFANGGFKVKPFAVERVENSRGVVIYENPGPKIIKSIAYETAAEMTFMLKKVIEMGTGQGAKIGREAAGKTGTTDDYRDAWFVGYTPDLVTGVWVGNDDNSKMPGAITGGSVPARIWSDYMKIAIQNFPNSVFDYPEITPAKGSMSDIEKEPQEILEESEVVNLNNNNNIEDTGEPTHIENAIRQVVPAPTPAPLPAPSSSKKPFETSQTIQAPTPRLPLPTDEE